MLGEFEVLQQLLTSSSVSFAPPVVDFHGDFFLSKKENSGVPVIARYFFNVSSGV
jgi:hypothetical protein